MKDLVFGGATGKGLAHLRNLDTVADPGVTRRDGRWWMVLGGMQAEERVIHLYAAQSSKLDAGWQIITSPDDPRQAARLAEPPPSGAWDATGYHCPSYARGRDAGGAVIERIYYASSAEWGSLYGPYQIGFLQWDGTRWVRHPEPVFTASHPWERGTVLEPNVLYDEGAWLLRYTAGLAVDGRPSTGSAESGDGISGWRRRGQPESNRFDALVAHDGDGFALITSRHPLDSVFTPEHGLWRARGGSPHGPWKPARHIVRTIDGTPWHDAGVWKPTAVADGRRRAVFFTVAQRSDNPYAPALGVGGIILGEAQA
ncbi:hypothetical protein ACIBHY_28515 [Nonomuraea sp. NPDC050547]|uniref:hypothetical protein n=1 Tax=Nonomuraea sp. NPDC050547 TaxID=3364368 RepID=UPI00378FE1CB